MIPTSLGGSKPLVERLAVLAFLMTLTLCYPPPARAQQQRPGAGQDDLRRELEAVKESLSAIQRELQEIKQLLARQNFNPVKSRELVVNIAGDPFKGEQNAQLTLIEFSDYQCPFCSRYIRDTFPLIERDYIKTGKLKYVFRDFPLETIHPNALVASVAAGCAGEQGKYWEMHDQLFSNQAALGAGDMTLHAKAAGVEPTQFRQCLDSRKYEGEIRKKMAEGASLGVRGTPSFFLGLTVPNDPRVKVVKVLRGAVPYANFKEIIDEVLSSQR